MVLTNLTKEREEHLQNLTKLHNMYCPFCDKFIIGNLTDAGIYGYHRICPIHGKLEN